MKLVILTLIYTIQLKIYNPVKVVYFFDAYEHNIIITYILTKCKSFFTKSKKYVLHIFIIYDTLVTDVILNN